MHHRLCSKWKLQRVLTPTRTMLDLGKVCADLLKKIVPFVMNVPREVGK
ncbi:hypothetical protein TSMEX_001310 [Taenia solium]|eukprot:TsM_000606000 transcript=TsM_000606000 gene=TsM_000606000